MRPRLFRPRSDADAALREELETHIAMWRDHFLGQGHSAEAAETMARDRFGSFDESVRKLSVSDARRDRSQRVAEFRRQVIADLTIAWRQARRRPALTIVALLTFALGLGANTAMFSVVRGILLRPLPFDNPDRLVAVWPARTISNAELMFYQRESRTLSAFAAFSPGWGMALTGSGESRQIQAARVSTNFFSTLGVSPMVGRTFGREESEPGKWSVVILSSELWTTQFGADRSVIGRVITLDGGPVQVVGVMPPGFEFYVNGVDAWLPLQVDPSSPYHLGQTAIALGRLTPDGTAGKVSAEFQALAPRARQLFGFDETYGRGGQVMDLRESLVGGSRRSLMILIGGATILILIAVANVANLLLLQSAARQREFAVRRALGSSRGALIRHLLTQSVSLAIVGGGVGLAAAMLGLQLLKSILPATMPMLASVGMDSGVFLVTGGTIVVAGVAFGLWPAWSAAEVDPDDTLRSGSSDFAGRRGFSVRRTLVIAEVMLAVVLVAGATLMARTLWNLRHVDLGFDANRVMTLRLQPTNGQISAARTLGTYFETMTRQVAGVPGVIDVGAIHHLPLSGFSWRSALEIEGRPLPAQAERPSVVWRSIAGNYFGAMRIPLVRGRLFTTSDTRGAPNVVIISNTMARRFWPDSDPIGAHIKLGLGQRAESATVVGIVGEVRSQTPDAPAVVELYRPIDQGRTNSMFLVIRARGDERAIVPGVRAAIRSLDPVVPIAEVRSLASYFASSTTTQRTIAILLGAFAALGGLLGAVGIYGVIASSVLQRKREIGIRSALGADQRRVARMVLADSLRLASIGVVLGTAAALVAARTLRAFVFGVTTTDPLVYVGVAAGVGLIAIVAAFGPARRASGIDPLEALREG
jgi:predicted permease